MESKDPVDPLTMAPGQTIGAGGRRQEPWTCGPHQANTCSRVFRMLLDDRQLPYVGAELAFDRVNIQPGLGSLRVARDQIPDDHRGL